jgi:hypothetical protein
MKSITSHHMASRLPQIALFGVFEERSLPTCSVRQLCRKGFEQHTGAENQQIFAASCRELQAGSAAACAAMAPSDLAGSS